jgi:hypothetical protein
MGQFKPMVKMMTTEPSVILKLKKGGKVSKMAMGGNDFVPMQSAMTNGMPSMSAPMGVAPKRPPMAMRRKAMNPLMMAKKGGKAENEKMDKSQDKAMIKKAFKQHDMQEHKGDKGTSLKLKKGGKMATGGVIDGQGGYAKGGIIKTEGQGGAYRNTKMHTAKPDNSPAKTGDVKDGNGGGYATGGVAKANGGGYKMGGKASKKAYAAGGTVNSGRPVAMPQGSKPASKPVRINELAGTFKRGGTVKMNDGGSSSEKLEDMSKGAYDKAPKYSRDLEDALNPLGMVKELAGKAKDYFMPKKAGSVTKESITVTPAGKKRGGQAC